MSDLYCIVRFFKSGRGGGLVHETGLTLAEARAWCRREDTRAADGSWFDGYDLESNRPKQVAAFKEEEGR